MKASHVWFGFVLVVVGVCGILDTAGIVDSRQTIGQWWPVAIIGWPIVEMLAARQVTLTGAICTTVGLALLADSQEWAIGTLIWSGLAVFAGLAILVRTGVTRFARDGGNKGNGTPVSGAVTR